MDIYKFIILHQLEKLEERIKDLEKVSHPQAKFVCLECGGQAERVEE